MKSLWKLFYWSTIHFLTFRAIVASLVWPPCLTSHLYSPCSSCSLAHYPPSAHKGSQERTLPSENQNFQLSDNKLEKKINQLKNTFLRCHLDPFSYCTNFLKHKCTFCTRERCGGRRGRMQSSQPSIGCPGRSFTTLGSQCQVGVRWSLMVKWNLHWLLAGNETEQPKPILIQASKELFWLKDSPWPTYP